MTHQNTSIGQIASLLRSSQCAVAFTGAGISTESGIPDFRSPGGLWDKYQPIYFDDYMSSIEMRKESWRRKIQTDKVIGVAKPNTGHLSLAQLVADGHLRSIITQNIDGLHQSSGISEQNIIELHGNSTYAKCLDCQKRFDLKPLLAAFEKDETLPVCDECRGIVKTGTISFGQPMPEEEMERAYVMTEAADVFIVLGSSLSVYPAAAFPENAARRGAKLIIINRDPTPLDPIADIVIHASIGETLSKVCHAMAI
ncbi:SIR2 family NAD-dependent protein deacylase [Aurantivibrio plasticivorans]